jgi:hypothetical protein
MKTYHLIKTAILMLAVTASGCRKNDSIPVTDNSSQKMQEFFQKNAPAFESFTINAQTGGLLISSKGTRYSIPANSFTDANGNLVTGTVDVSVKELSKASEMILSNKPATTGNGSVLQSFGEFQVIAAKSGNVLKLKTDSAIRVQVKPNNIGAVMLQEMPLWRGDSSVEITRNGFNDDNQPTTVSHNFMMPRGITWSQIAATMASFNGGYYNFKIDSLVRWSNCDALASQPGTPITVLGYLGDKFNTATGGSISSSEPSMLFYKSRNVNTMVKLYNVIMTPTPGKEGFLSYQNSFRIGGQGTFLAISAKGGKFYADMQDVTIPSPASGKNYVPYTFTMQEVTESSLLLMIQQMDNK